MEISAEGRINTPKQTKRTISCVSHRTREEKCIILTAPSPESTYVHLIQIILILKRIGGSEQ
jgi:hypothetical protein